MTTLNNNQNMQHKSVIIAGISLLLMTIAAFFAYGYAHSSLVVNGDAMTTLKNIQASFSLFEMEIFGWLVIIITDLLVAWSFYIFLKPIHPKYSLLAGWLRLLYTAILATAVSNLVIAKIIVRDNTSLFTGSMERQASQMMLSITAFESIWSLGLIVFGVHLVVTGFVALKAKQIPKFISILLIAAGFSYMFIHFMHNFLPQLDSITTLLETILSIPMMVGELGFGFWLLLKGIKWKSID